jgi:hypothetical protein
MGLRMREKRAVIGVTAEKYRRARKKEKGAILEQLVELTGYTRRYAAWLLRHHGKRTRAGTTIVVGDITKKIARTRPRQYEGEVVEVLKKIWLIMDCICGKRLRVALEEIIPVLRENFEIQLSREDERKLQKMSAATIDRLLASERKKYNLKGRSQTKPGTLLKHQIPIRTFSDWDESKPGFVEIDLVGHDGGDGSGDFCQTLDVTDVATGWTETEGVRNKAQVWVFKGLTAIRKRLPFHLLGIDSDNGSEFINNELYRYCIGEKITFTRARPHRKNDNCFVEEKNWSVVRRNVGYGRYDTVEELEVLNELYSHLRLYTNYFLPTMKLVKKERVGSRIKKTYDQPKTPYRRVLGSTFVTAAQKRRLSETYQKLNPAELKRNITRLQRKLEDLTIRKERIKEATQDGRARRTETKVGATNTTITPALKSTRAAGQKSKTLGGGPRA